MTQSVRRRDRSSSSQRKTLLRNKFLRRLAPTERLEDRSLMAGDVYAGMWNSAWPTDVNHDKSVDAQDILSVVYDLNTHGIRKLEAPATVLPLSTGGEGEGGVVPQLPAALVDVDRDGEATPADVLYVIRAFNGGGEGEGELVRFRVAAVKLNTPNTTGEVLDPLTLVQNLNPGAGGNSNPTPATTLQDDFSINGVAAIDKGTPFELRFYVQDTSGPNSIGVFSGYFDVIHDPTKAVPVVNEIQSLDLTSSNDIFTGGTFTITYNGQTATVTPVFGNGVMNKFATATSIKNALVSLDGIDANDLDVFYIVPTVPTAPQNLWEIRFKGALENKNLSAISADITNLTTSGTNKAVTIEEFNGGYAGGNTDTEAFRKAFVPSTAQIQDEQQRVGRAYTANVAAAYVDAAEPNLMNEIGTLGQPFGPNPGTTEREFLRVKMIAIDGTAPGQPITYQLDPADKTSSKTLLFNDPANVIPANMINYGLPFQLIVREYVSAQPDLFTTGNSTALAGTSYQLNVLANNGSTADSSSNGTAFQIDPTGLSTPSLGGSVIVMPGNQSIQYTPAAGYTIAPVGAGGANVQTETFTYTIAATDAQLAQNPAYRDTATVTVNLIVPNLPPVHSAPTNVSFNEGGFFTFNGANAISVSDNDAGAVGLTMDLSVPTGTLNLGSTGTGVSGNGTNHIVITGRPLSEINTFLTNLIYAPANADANGQVLLTLSTNDNGSGIGAPATDLDIVTITINAVNDAPTQSLPGGLLQTTDEDPLAIPGITVNDIDLNEGSGLHQLTTTLAIPVNSFGKLDVTANGGAEVSGGGTRTLTLTGSISQVNAALNNLVYTPVLNQIGPMTINVTTSDNGNSPAPAASSGTQSVVIDVQPATRPRAVNDQFSVAEESGQTILPSVLTNDKVHDSATGLVTSTQPGNITVKYAAVLGGAIIAAPSGVITQVGEQFSIDTTVLPANFFGTVTFEYSMDDTLHNPDPGSTLTATVTVTVTNVNDAPTAVQDPDVAVDEDTAVAINVVTNDTDPDNDALTATIVNGPAHGSIVSNTAGVVTYKGSQDYFGDDSFTYRANDATTQSAELITVTIHVAPVNDAPVATNFGVTTNEGNAAVINFEAVNRVTDVDNIPTDLLASIIGAPTNGTLFHSGNMQFTYLPFNLDFFGSDSFTYQVDDNDLDSNIATVTITINPVNDAPVAGNDSKVTGENQSVDINVLANDSDVDASATFTAVPGLVRPGTGVFVIGNPAHGSVQVLASGQIRYTPANLYNGPDSFTYKLNDLDSLAPANQESNLATVTIDVLPKNDPPIAANDSASTAEDMTVAIDVFFNDDDPDSAKAQFAFVPVTQPQHGTITFNTTTRKVDYKPFDNYNGSDSFSYKVNDQSPIAPINLDSNVAVVSINVSEVNDAPTLAQIPVPLIIANGDNDVVNEIEILQYAGSGVDAPAVDAPIIISAAGSATGTLKSVAGGTLTIQGSKIIYKAPSGQKDFNDSFVVTVTDRNGTGLSVTQTINFFVQEAVPFNLHINVFQDQVSNALPFGDGVRQATEAGMSGVAVTVVGVDFKGANVVIPNLVTDRFGRLDINRILPGRYVVQVQQPSMTSDGIASENDSRAVLVDQLNDIFELNVPIIPAAGQSPDIFLNVGEAGIAGNAYQAAFSTPGARPYSGLLVSNAGNGMNLAVNANGSTAWSSLVAGWSNVQSVRITNFAIGSNIAVLRVTAVGGGETLVQINLNANPGFEIIGADGQGGYLLRINGSAAQFGLTQFVPTANGESFAAEADAFFGSFGG